MLLSPVIREQAAAFRTQAPQSLADLRGAWQESGNALLAGPGQQLLGRGIAFIQSPGQAQEINVPQGAALGLLTGLGGGVIGLVTVLIISFYYLMERSWIRRIVLLDSAPETRIRVSRIWDEVEQKVGDWLRGQLTLCLVIGVTATIGYAVIGIQFWPLLGLWAGITEIIPILGPWLGGVPAVIIALTQGWEKAAPGHRLRRPAAAHGERGSGATRHARRRRLDATDRFHCDPGRNGVCRDPRGAAGDPDRGRHPGHAVALHRGAAGGEAGRAIGIAGLAVDARLGLAAGILSVSSGDPRVTGPRGIAGDHEWRTGVERRCAVSNGRHEEPVPGETSRP